MIKYYYFRYGYPASTLTGDTLSTMGNVYNIAHNARVITPKGLMKRTGAGMIHGYSSSSRASTSYEASSSTSDNKYKVTQEKMETEIESNEIDVGENKTKKG